MISISHNAGKEKASSLQSNKKSHTFRRLLRLALPYKKSILLAAICVLLINAAQIAKPYILKVTIDNFLMNKEKQHGLYSIAGMGIIYLLVVIVSGILSISQVMIINKAGQGIIKKLRGDVFKTIQLMPLSFIDKTSSGTLITRTSNDVEALSEMYTDVLIDLFKDVFLILGITYMMVMLNIKLSLISFCVIPVMAFIIVSMKSKIKNNFMKMKRIVGKINGFMAESLSGMKIIQIFGGEKIKQTQFDKLNKQYYDASLVQMFLNSILRPSADVFMSVSIALLIWYGMGKIHNGELSIGVLYAFTTYIKQFFEPIGDLSEDYGTIQSALVSADRIFEIVDQKKNAEDLDAGKHIERFHGSVEFKHVWFAYKGEEWILKDISFKINDGDMCAFVGETGAGKSTIISLISGFYKVQRGEILIDGVNIDDICRRDLRRNVSVVLQDVFLFSCTVRDNIVLNDDIDEETLNNSIEISQVKNIISNFKDGIYEKVVEGGNTFSAGQKQLISFARAIAHNPSIFVLDEATANIDTETEILIQKAIKSITDNVTTIVIAHRLSTIKDADKIIVLKDGEIIEQGNHGELMERQGYYSSLVMTA